MAKSLLVLGGSHFLGKAVAEEALLRSWEVTVFNRGRTGSNPDGVTALRGDRTNEADLERLAALGSWDAVVDTSGMTAEAVEAAARVLLSSTSRYVYVSTVSVYAGWPLVPLSEDHPTLTEAPPATGMPKDVNVPYGVDKARCEAAARRHLGERLTILRPGVILGPHEYVGRLPWWLRRIERGGSILAPGRPDQQIQPVDVRDVAQFACHRVEAATTSEVFNVAAPNTHTTMEGLLRACLEVVQPKTASLEWVDSEFLLDREVKQWTEVPLWRTYPGTWQVSGERAHNAGLACRPLSETVADTWVWMSDGGSAVEHERASLHGLDAVKETALLDAWRADLRHS
ncbi:NAD-dependent epimerase/dehydratase family protein [Streptomyces netropsis]|uniref:NAD-dependent epimerase/dehydratase family protein n=1 Tax=Streptomyces netropsis TaxID=55404 RepID=UPI0037AEF73D